MLKEIFRKHKIEYFSAVPSALLNPANKRLYEGLPSGDLQVIFYLMPYYVEDTDPALSKYAAVYDYHALAREISGDAIKYLSEKYPSAFFAAYTDHSPFAEVYGASAAGLGDMGANGLLINKKYSSFVFIGEIICDLTGDTLTAEGIPYSAGTASHCKSCGGCLNKCPMGCEDFSRCVSGINQKKGELSIEEEKAVKDSGYIWGCDICQFSCPTTIARRASGELETPIEYFKIGAIRENAARRIEKMTDEEFEKYPFSWRKREIILRNIKIAEGGKDEKN